MEYDEYIRFIIDRAVADGALMDAASQFLMCRQMPESRKFEEMKRLLSEFDSAPLSALVGLPFRSVVTTNFDRTLFASYAKYRGVSAREVNIDDPSLDAAPFADDLYVARVHGRVEIPSSMRLSREHFALLPTNGSYVGFLEHLFTRRQVMFIGFSFLDPAISSVLKSVRAKTGSLHGQEHWAFIPKGSSSEFITELELHSIRRVEYSPDNSHQELWDGIEMYTRCIILSLESRIDVRDIPFAAAKKYLATAYARSRLGRQREPLAQAMAEGIVSGILAGEPSGQTEAQLTERLSSELAMDEDAARTLVARSVIALARDGLCEVKPELDAVRYLSKVQGQSAYDDAVTRVVDGIVQRFRLREGGTDSPEVRSYLKNVLGELLLHRGWELGAAYAGRRMPEDVDLGSVMDKIDLAGVRESQFAPLERSLKDLLLSPDDEEAVLLADLGRTAFGLELLLEAPHDSLFIARSLPERFYFDANVVMPAITIGHPLQKVFQETISSLQSTAGAAATGPSLRVYDGFLNEIVSHRRLAIVAMESGSGEGALWEERAVGLFGTANVNVYVGAYFNYRVNGGAESFRGFLNQFAPYDNESLLKRYLEKQGFEVIREDQADKGDLSGILHSLEKFYAKRFEQHQKSATVVRHDAVQLSILNADLAAQRRTVFVSADRGIRLALDAGGYGAVANSILTHIGLAQLVELVVGRLPASRGIASLLWMAPVSSDAEKIRSHLLRLALEQHDAALAKHMPEVVSDIVEDARYELNGMKLKLDTESPQEQIKIRRVLERYEKDFFRRMNEEIEKRGL